MNSPPPDFAAVRQSLLLEGRPRRMPAMELVVDNEIASAVMGHPVDRKDAVSMLAFQRKMGYDYVNVYSDLRLEFNRTAVAAAGPAGQAVERAFINEQDGPITTDEEFEAYPWPDASTITFDRFAAVRPLLPEGMAMVARCHGPFEWGTWLMGIERFSIALIDNRPLVERVFARASELILAEVAGMVRQDGVGAVWISDDLGFNSGPFISPRDLAALVFPTYREICRLARERDLPVILHSCGKLHSILPTLIACGIHAVHSLPPGLYDLHEMRDQWGDRLCLLGNVDVDLLARGTETDVRQAVRQVKDLWRETPSGGIILSSSNSIANYSKVENYLAMMDEAVKE